MMLKNYIKTAYRNIFRRKGYSFINIIGLAIGLAVCVLIMLWVQDELDYDRSHKNAENAHLLIYSEQLSTGRQVISSQMAPLAPLLKENIPEIINYARYVRYNYPLASEDKSFTELVCFADPAYYVINRWLEEFAYRMDISWTIFLVAGAAALVIALLTVCYQALKAALANPVESLKCE